MTAIVSITYKLTSPKFMNLNNFFSEVSRILILEKIVVTIVQLSIRIIMMRYMILTFSINRRSVTNKVAIKLGPLASLIKRFLNFNFRF